MQGIVALLALCSILVSAETVGNGRYKQTFYPPQKRSLELSTQPSITVQFLATLKVGLTDLGLAAYRAALEQVAPSCSLVRTTQTGRARTLIVVNCTFSPGSLAATNKTERQQQVAILLRAVLSAAVIVDASADTPLAVEEDTPIQLRLPTPVIILPPSAAGAARKKRSQILATDATASSGLPPYVEEGAPWHLDRIDEHARLLDGFYSYYGNGSGHTGYVIDTGAPEDGHVEFDPPGRVVGIGNTIDGTGPTDCHGHGTHVSGILAGLYVGVAKAAYLRVVKALDCFGSGTTSSVVSALYMVDDDASNVRPGDPADPFVINLSLNGPMSQSMTDAMNTLRANHRVSIVVAAGNSGSGACNTAPAAIPGVIAVGATASSDQLASFSNYGTCVPWYAPGVSIVSAYLGGQYAVMSGTSMASPLKAGIDLIIGGQMVDGGFVLGDGDHFSTILQQAAYAQRTVVQGLDKPLTYASFDASSTNNYGLTPPPPPPGNPPPPPAPPNDGDSFPPAPPPVLLIAPPLHTTSQATRMHFIAAFLPPLLLLLL